MVLKRSTFGDTQKTLNQYHIQVMWVEIDLDVYVNDTRTRLDNVLLDQFHEFHSS